jgi:transposase
MTRTRTRQKVDAGLKARVAVAAIREDQTTAQIGSTFGVHPSQVSKWKKKAVAALPGIFAGEGGALVAPGTDEKLVSALYEEIGRLTVEVDFLKKKLSRCQ